MTRVLAALALTITGFDRAQADSYPEEAVKAAFLYRFAGYVEWPPGAMTGDTFVIGVAGADGVREQLARLLPGRTIKDRRAEVRGVAGTSDLASVHMLFVGRDRSAAELGLLAAAATRPILLVTDESGGLQSGATINLVPSGRNLRFEVSLRAADRSGLRISSGLLSVAVRVDDRPQASLMCRSYRTAVLPAQRCSPALVRQSLHVPPSG